MHLGHTDQRKGGPGNEPGKSAGEKVMIRGPAQSVNAPFGAHVEQHNCGRARGIGQAGRNAALENTVVARLLVKVELLCAAREPMHVLGPEAQGVQLAALH